MTTSLLVARRNPKGIGWVGQIGTLKLPVSNNLDALLARAREHGYTPLDGADWEQHPQPTVKTITVTASTRTVSLAAQARAESHADPVWKEFAKEALRAVAVERGYVTADDVWTRLAEQGVAEPLTPAAMGAVMSWGRREGLIEMTGERRESRRLSNHRTVVVWRSRVVDLRPASMF